MTLSPELLCDVRTKREVVIRHVEVMGQSIRVAIWPGNREKTPLMMFSGIAARIDLLTPLADALGDIEIVTFEIPGSGESPRPVLPYNMPMLAAFASRVLTQMGYRHVDVLGLSWGGTLAQQFAIQYPRRCRRLILAATFAGTPFIPGHMGALMELTTARRFNDPEHRRRIAGALYGGMTHEEDAAVEVLDDLYGKTSKTGYMYQLLALTGWSSHIFLPFIRQPTLVLAGESDPIIPVVNAQCMAAMIPNSKLHVMKDGHLFFVSSCPEASEVVREFLTVPHPTARKNRKARERAS